MTSLPSEGGNKDGVQGRLWFSVIAVAVLLALIAAFWPRPKVVSGNTTSPEAAGVGGRSGAAAGQSKVVRRFGVARAGQSTQPAEEIVAEKMRQFGRNRRAIEERIAKRLGEELPPEIDAFFKAVDKGDWEEIDRRWNELLAHQQNHDRPDLEPYWSAVHDTYGTAEQVHLWPAQKLLDYGNAILDSLRPGMVYVGGTDNGRWVPELLNETSGDPHIIITQNALADGGYMNYLSELYGGQLNMLSKEDTASAFEAYTADAQRRMQHDLDFPDEPKEVLPGENIKMVDGKVQVSGQTAVMAINEKILQMLVAQNPELSFALQESFPLRGFYADAVPLGPLMELNANSDQVTFNASDAAQSVDYWRSVTEPLLSTPQGSGSEYAMGAYAKDINATANLLAAHNFTSQAEEAYRMANQLWPSNPEPVEGLAQLLGQSGHVDQARSLLDAFAAKYPDQRKAIEQARAKWTVTFGTR